MPRIPSALAVAAAAALAWPAGAGASGAVVIDGVLRIFTGPGEANRLQISGVPRRPFTVRDAVPLGVGDGCTSTGPRSAVCTLTVLSVTADLGDRDDRFSAATAAPVSVQGGPGADVLAGGRGGDVLTGESGTDRLLGGSGGDVLSGGAGGDRLDGGVGADTLDGGPGADVLLGGAGADVVDGGTGADRLTPGPGRDTAYAGPGRDRLLLRDGAPDRADCRPGPGDVAVGDPVDRLRGC